MPTAEKPSHPETHATIRWHRVVGGGGQQPPSAKVAPGPKAKRVLDRFGGRVVEVDPKDRPEAGSRRGRPSRLTPLSDRVARRPVAA